MNFHWKLAVVEYMEPLFSLFSDAISSLIDRSIFVAVASYFANLGLRLVEAVHPLMYSSPSIDWGPPNVESESFFRPNNPRRER